MGRKMSKYMKKGMSIFLVVIMILGTGTNILVFANDVDAPQDLLLNTKNEMVLPSMCTRENVTVDFPEEIQGSKLVLQTERGIVYHENSNVRLSIQSIKTKEGGINLVGNKMEVSIERASASKKYSFNFNLPPGYRLIKSEDYYAELQKENEFDEGELIVPEIGWIYVLNYQGEIVSVIDPAKATDAKGKLVDTRYDIMGTTLVQYVDFGNDSSFPIKIGLTSTKPENHKLRTETHKMTFSHSVIGGLSFASGTTSKVLSDASKKKIEDAIVKRLGTKVIPIIGWASWAITGYATVQDLRGYDYTDVVFTYDVWAIYKHQGGRWVQGRQYKNVKISVDIR